jgi:membrane protein required for colicin V production
VNWLDIIIIAISLVLAFFGLRNGLIKAIFSLAGLVGGILLAGRYYHAISALFFQDSAGAEVGAYILILVVSIVVATLLASVLERALSLVMLGWVNRLGGAIFGLAVGLLVSAAVLAAVTKFFGGGEAISESQLAATLIERFPLLLALLPPEFDTLHQFFQ